MATPVVICAPAGSGKSQHAEALKAMFGCTCIVDSWDGVSPLPEGALALTNVMPVTPMNDVPLDQASPRPEGLAVSMSMNTAGVEVTCSGSGGYVMSGESCGVSFAIPLDDAARQ